MLCFAILYASTASICVAHLSASSSNEQNMLDLSSAFWTNGIAWPKIDLKEHSWLTFLYLRGPGDCISVAHAGYFVFLVPFHMQAIVKPAACKSLRFEQRNLLIT